MAPEPNQPTWQPTWGVVVAFNRPVELDRLLTRLMTQTLPLAGVIVVDNANLPQIAALAVRHGAEYIGSKTNLGGAGGFALGMLTALTRGAKSIWVWDDDGYPDSDDCLQLLADCAASRGADVACPLVVAEHDASKTAFIFRIAGQRTNSRELVQKYAQIDHFGHLFNGCLVDTMALQRVGMPDYRLFIRGDEVDFGHRVRRSGGLIVTCTSAIARHPSGEADIQLIPRTPFGVLFPANSKLRSITFRNRGYIFFRYRQWGYLLTDPVRYACFFLVRRRPDWRGLSEWWSATRQGYRESFGNPRINGPDAAPVPPTRKSNS
jgi:rhamnopyranosyl-N-acetylglucosaminyl-diphospho-decaprenol beta-1,3/1,4-galactofuranosyltransferase